MELITAFKASDGSIFATEEDCLAYEFSLAWRERIEEFLNNELNPYPSGTQRHMTAKIIVAWERYKTA